MDSKITIPKSVCHDEVVDYIASRYSITPQQVINHFMRQEGILINRQGIGDEAISPLSSLPPICPGETHIREPSL